jgi:demethylmenaquinone methyltransferase/2-methoxy-6-polyprenyl-1,4-benzoquinol methylase
MFGRIATRYDMVNRILSARRDVAWRRTALGMMPASSGIMLDLATGTHDLALDALALGRAGRVHGCDFCPPMLDAGRRRRRGHAVTATAGDGLALPFTSSAFDAAVMAYGLRNFDDPAKGLRELARVLKPGAPLMILEFFRPETWFPKLFHRVFSVVAPIIGATFTGDGSAYAYLHESIQGFRSPREMDQMLKEAGYTNIRWKSFSGGVSHAVVADRADDNGAAAC